MCMYEEVLEVIHDPCVVVDSVWYYNHINSTTEQEMPFNEAVNQILLYYIDELTDIFNL